MSCVVEGSNVSDAWLKAIKYLLNEGGDSYNLIVEIQHPIEEDIGIKKNLDDILKKTKDRQVTETVASTIFPRVLWENGKPRADFFHRFLTVYPYLKKVNDNRRGTYFGRLVNWDDEDISFNQLEDLINKLKREKELQAPVRVRYEMSIYDPLKDSRNRMGFPCMSFISVKIRGNALDLTAIYRNQHFLKKAYGNYLGLGRLLHFICNQTGYELGAVTCIATHAQLENGYKRKLKGFFRDE